MTDSYLELLQRPTLTVDELAKLMRVSRNLAYEAVQRNEVAYVRLGRRIVIPTSAVRKMLGIGEEAA